MKLRYFYSAVMTAFLALGFTACSNDEDTPEVKPEPKVKRPRSTSLPEAANTGLSVKILMSQR